MRALKIAGSAIAAVIVVLTLLAIVGIPSGFLTSAIQARVERDTGYRLTIAGATKVGVWPSLNVTLNDVTLQDPRDRDGTSRLTVGSVQADVTLGSVWSGHPQVTELVITRPVLHVPLLRERTGPLAPSRSPAPASGEPDATTPIIERVRVADGAVEFSNLRDRVNTRIDGINANAVMSDDRKIKITGSAKSGEQPLTFDIDATAPAHPGERQNIPVELKLEAPGALQAPLSAKAEVRLNGAVVMINGVSGTLGDGAFNGWASADLSSKPLVKLDLDFQRLDVAGAAKGGASPAQGLQNSWSNTTINLTGLNYVDVQARISAAEINIGEAHIAPAAIDGALAGGILKARFCQSRRLWRPGQRRSDRRCLDGKPNLYVCNAILPAYARYRCCGARPISTSSMANCRPSSRCVRPATASAPSCPTSTAPCSRCSRTAPSVASTSRR